MKYLKHKENHGEVEKIYFFKIKKLRKSVKIIFKFNLVDFQFKVNTFDCDVVNIL